jgi:hypothetical protein
MATNADGTTFGKHWGDKIRLLDEIDALRGPVPAAPVAVVEELPPADSVATLQEKLRVYESTCAMLEREVHVLEQQTFASLAEASRLRRELDRSKAERDASPFAGSPDYVEKEQLTRIVQESEHERRLLIDALESSEAELARMVKTLDLVVRKLQVA